MKLEQGVTFEKAAARLDVPEALIPAMTLRGADALAFAEALLNPSPPNKALLEAARDYRLMVEERLEPQLLPKPLIHHRTIE
jgi:hypothetical protein